MCILMTALFITVVTICYGQASYVPGEIMIQVAPQDSRSEEAALAAITQACHDVHLRSGILLSRRMHIWLFNFTPGVKPDLSVLGEVKACPYVREAQFNHYLKLRELIPDDTYFDDQWAMKNTGQLGGTPDADIDATDAWDYTTGGLTATGDTIVIGIVDNGFDILHEDLDFWKNYEEIPGNGIDDDQNGYVDDFDGWNAILHSGQIYSGQHGTHVAGIAGAIGNNGIGVTGVCWHVKLMPVISPTGLESGVVEAYGYILEMRARYNESNGLHGAFVVATNASFGVDQGNPDDYPLWGAMYDSLGHYGVLSTAATANVDWDIDVVGDVPSGFPSDFLITVTNTTNNDVKFSPAAWGLITIDLGAPGYAIKSTVPNNDYFYNTGTSMSTPHVTGAIALIFAAADAQFIQDYKNNLQEKALEIKNFILQTADVISSLDGLTVSGGRLDVYKAILALKGYPVLKAYPLSLAITLGHNTSGSLMATLTNAGGSPGSYNITMNPQAPWLEIDPVNGSVNPGATEEVTLTFSTTGLQYGYYYTTMTVIEAPYYSVNVPVTLHVTPFVGIAGDPVVGNTGLSCYPNPFTDVTSISFIINRDERVKLEIFNIHGQQLLSLTDLPCQPGEHTFQWDGRDGGGHRVKPGIYLCRLMIETHVFQLKLLKLS
jgi:subtilisin family serine protease